jgi:hypothetical protein
MSIDQDILKNLGGLQNNSFLHVIDSNEIVQDEEPVLINHSPYVNDEMLVETIKCKSDVFKCLSLNIQSVNAKIQELRIYIEHLQQENCAFDAILLQETWLNESNNTDLLQINGYQLISQPCKSTSHGGLAIYLKDNFDFEILSINVSNSNLWEGLFIKTKISEFKHLTLGSIYRPPRNSIDNYTTFMNELDCTLKQLHGEVVIGGDTNIDLLKINERPIFHEIFDCILSNGFIPKITLPTRLTRTNGTLIDNFCCRISNNFSQSTSGICSSLTINHILFVLISSKPTINPPNL